MFEVLVIENVTDTTIPLACWTEVFHDYESAVQYRDAVLFDEPISYRRCAVTTLITNIHVSQRVPIIEVQP